MLASPEAAKFVLATHAHFFKPTYPKSKEKIIGPSALFFHQAGYHARLRKLVQSSLSPERIKKLIPDIEAIAISALESCAVGQVINTFKEMKKVKLLLICKHVSYFSFDVGILSIFGNLDDSYREKLKQNYLIVDKGYNSFPSNIPGTAYHKALLARKRLSQIVSEIICERKEKRLLEKDLLGCLLNSRDEKGRTLTEDQIADNIIGVLFAAQDTTASVLTWILKYLHDNPKLLEAVKAEQKLVHESNNGGQRALTWAQTKNMRCTYRFILESMRMASIISFTFREAVCDVEYKEPQKVDPSRFKVAPRPNTFVPFGLGVHACPGNELAKLEMLILIHHLVTEFRYKFTLTTASSSLHGKSWARKMGFNTAHFRFRKKDSRLDFGESLVEIANSIVTKNLSTS
ncbi:Abscisic acid 8'-hydroxylase 4 [Citrus sinensis]|nr:Abscisic acid 8'-hydroxylase 4 [Citrus sinensis]